MPEHERARRVVRAIFDALVADPERLPPGDEEPATRVTDYLAGMTDRFALQYAAALAAE
jgi:dGTP triphosphohydrolase